jgi:hypothetical protein
MIQCSNAKENRIKPFLIEIVKLISFDRRFWRFTLYKPDTYFVCRLFSFVLRHFCVLLLNTWCWAALWLFTRTPQDIRLSGFIRLFGTSIWIQTDQNRKKDSAMSLECVCDPFAVALLSYSRRVFHILRQKKSWNVTRENVNRCGMEKKQPRIKKKIDKSQFFVFMRIE